MGTAPLQVSDHPATGDVPVAELTVGALLRERAAQRPEALALVATRHDGTAGRWTYAELLAEAERLAGGLLALVEPGEHVALLAPNVAEWVLLEYAAALAGCPLVAVNPALRPADIAYALQKSRARVLVHADRVRTHDLTAVVAEAATGVDHVVSLSAPDRLYGPPPEPVERSAPDRAAMIQFTSGTTAQPKAVLLAHRALVNNARFTMLAAEVPEGVVAIAPLPMFHTAGCVISTLGPAFLGGVVVLIENFDPAAVLAAAAAEGASALMSVPTVLGAVLQAAGEAAPQLDTVLVGAATVPSTMIEAVTERFGAAVHNLYGQTELAPVVSLTRRADPPEDLVTSVGRPLPHTAVRVVDAAGAVVPLGVPGEICARGYNQMIEYFGDPEATAAAVDADGYLHTGDLGTMDARGTITLTGRLKELIIRGGENIAPAEIEVALAAHPAVAEAAVIGLPDEKWGEIVAAVVVTHARPGPDLGAELAAHCGAHLAPFKIPTRWFFRTELPHTASGKVQKFVLRKALRDA